jgi:hypothetical protein
LAAEKAELARAAAAAKARGDGGDGSGVGAVAEVGLDATKSPAEMLRMFSDALVHNPHLKNKISARRFAFVGKMEAAASLTDPSKWHAKDPKLYAYACLVTWDMLVARMVT